MALALLEILRHPTFTPADPLVRAGHAAVDSAHVRWVHSSEVLEIAPLLRGGELLLSGGRELTLAPAAAQIAYVQSLADRGIAALAVETGSHLPALSSEIIRTAERAGLPLIELRAVVPFVEVAEAINSVLVSEFVSQIQRADAISHTMAAELARGATLERLLNVLAEMIPADVGLTDISGAPLGAGAPELPPAGSERRIEIEVPVRGAVVALMRIDIPEGGDTTTARITGERAVDILALAMLQRRLPSLREVARIELVRAIVVGAAAWRLPQLCVSAGLDPQSRMAVVVVRSLGGDPIGPTLQHGLERQGRSVVTYFDNGETIALVTTPPQPGTAGRASRSSLVEDVHRSVAGLNRVVAVGPSVAGIGNAGESLSEARLTLELAGALDTGSVTGGNLVRDSSRTRIVVDADEFAVERLAYRRLQPDVRSAFVDGVLSDLLEQDERRGTSLLETLSCWLDHGCNTAQAARSLHLERQSMHNRLHRIFELIGGDPRGTGRLAAVQLAARLARHLPPAAERD